MWAEPVTFDVLEPLVFIDDMENVMALLDSQEGVGLYYVHEAKTQ